MTGDPSTIFERQLAELSEVLLRISAEEFNGAAEMIANAPRVFLAGRGRNALALRGFGNRLAQLGKPVEIIGDILTGPVGQGDVVVIASSSGATLSLVDVAHAAHSFGALVLALTAGHDTPLARRSDIVVAVPIAFGDGRASTQPLGTLFEQSLTLLCDAMIVDLMDQLGVSVSSMRARHANIE